MWDTGTKALLHDEGLLGKMVGRLRQEMKEDRTSSVPTSSPRACPLCVLGLKSTVLPFFCYSRCVSGEFQPQRSRVRISAVSEQTKPHSQSEGCSG